MTQVQAVSVLIYAGILGRALLVVVFYKDGMAGAFYASLCVCVVALDEDYATGRYVVPISVQVGRDVRSQRLAVAEFFVRLGVVD